MTPKVEIDARRVVQILSTRIALLMEEVAILTAENEQLKQKLEELTNKRGDK